MGLVEEEWIESPDGWNHQDHDNHQSLAASTKNNHDNTHDNNDSDDEAPMMDLFADTNPREDITISIPTPYNYADDVLKIHLQAYKVDSDETARSTGVSLWNAAPRLARFLADNRMNLIQPHHHVIEVGAGLGLCGMMAQALGAARVVWTDGDTQALALLRQNVARNQAVLKRAAMYTNTATTIECRQLIWGHAGQLRDLPPFDVVLGADIVYTRESLEPLMDTVVAILSKNNNNKNNNNGKFILSRYTQWNNVSDQVVMEAGRKRGLTSIERPAEGIFVFSFGNDHDNAKCGCLQH